MSQGKNQSRATFTITLLIGLVLIPLGFAVLGWYMASLKNGPGAILTSVATVMEAPNQVPEDALLVKRNLFLEKCKVDKALDFYDVVDGKLAPRYVTGAEIVSCVESAFALTGEEAYDQMIIVAVNNVRASHKDLFQAHFNACKVSGMVTTAEELACVKYAHDRTVDAINK